MLIRFVGRFLLDIMDLSNREKNLLFLDNLILIESFITKLNADDSLSLPLQLESFS